jgi:hypothetical protein
LEALEVKNEQGSHLTATGELKPEVGKKVQEVLRIRSPAESFESRYSSCDGLMFLALKTVYLLLLQ